MNKKYNFEPEYSQLKNLYQQHKISLAKNCSSFFVRNPAKCFIYTYVISSPENSQINRKRVLCAKFRRKNILLTGGLFQYNLRNRKFNALLMDENKN